MAWTHRLLTQGLCAGGVGGCVGLGAMQVGNLTQWNNRTTFAWPGGVAQVEGNFGNVGAQRAPHRQSAGTAAKRALMCARDFVWGHIAIPAGDLHGHWQAPAHVAAAGPADLVVEPRPRDRLQGHQRRRRHPRRQNKQVRDGYAHVEGWIRAHAEGWIRAHAEGWIRARRRVDPRWIRARRRVDPRWIRARRRVDTRTPKGGYAHAEGSSPRTPAPFRSREPPPVRSRAPLLLRPFAPAQPRPCALHPSPSSSSPASSSPASSSPASSSPSS